MGYKLLSSLYYEDKKAYEELYKARFTNEGTYHMPVSIDGNDAFFTMSKEVMELITGIYKLDKELAVNINKLPGIALKQFMLKCIVDEIKITNDLENVYSTRKEIKELLVINNNNKIKRLYGLVQKYIMLSKGDDISIRTCKNVREIYDDLVLKEVVEEDKNNAPDGVIFRKEGVGIQAKNMKVIHRGVTPEDRIIEYVDACIDLLNDEKLNPIIAVAAVHYLIGYIHPFYDGNGRLNRYISSAYLAKELHPLVGYSISNTIKKNINLYHKSFRVCNDGKNKGDITSFVIYFMDVIYQSMLSLNEVMESKVQKYSYYKEKLSGINVSANVHELTYILLQNSLFGEDGMSVEQCAEIMEVSVSSVRGYLKQLPEGVLRVSRDGYTKLYDIDLDYWD